MNQRWVLQTQVAVALEDLETASAVLEAADEAIPSSLLASLKALVDRNRADLEAITSTEPTQPARAWQRLAQTVPVSQQAFREVLTVLGGALVRRERYDGGICQVADALVEEILACANRSAIKPVQWDGMSILDVTTSYTHVGGTVRLRFPELNVWALPVVAHEVGHLLVMTASVWDDVRNRPALPFLDLVTAKDNRGSPNAKLSELVADILATLAMGAAFACSALLLQFNPAEAHEPVRAHPPAAERAHVILAALASLGPDYEWVTQKLGMLWSGMLAVAECPALRVETVEELDKLVARTGETVNGQMRELPYKGLARAVLLEPHIRRHNTALNAGATPTHVRDVLNAAWRVRLMAGLNGTPLNLGKVSDRAATLCLRALSGGADV